MALLCYASAHWGSVLFLFIVWPEAKRRCRACLSVLSIRFFKINSQEKVELWPISTH